MVPLGDRGAQRVVPVPCGRASAFIGQVGEVQVSQPVEGYQGVGVGRGEQLVYRRPRTGRHLVLGPVQVTEHIRQGAHRFGVPGTPIVVLDLGDGPAQAGQVSGTGVQLLVVALPQRLP